MKSGDGKRAAYDTLRLTALTFKTGDGSQAAYDLVAPYKYHTLQSIVSLCMGSDRSQKASEVKWRDGHCTIGKLRAHRGTHTRARTACVHDCPPLCLHVPHMYEVTSGYGSTRGQGAGIAARAVLCTRVHDWWVQTRTQLPLFALQVLLSRLRCAREHSRSSSGKKGKFRPPRTNL